jgi:hypothetical protein
VTPAPERQRRAPDRGAAVGDGFPDQFGDIDDEIRFFLIWVTSDT